MASAWSMWIPLKSRLGDVDPIRCQFYNDTPWYLFDFLEVHEIRNGASTSQLGILWRRLTIKHNELGCASWEWTDQTPSCFSANLNFPPMKKMRLNLGRIASASHRKIYQIEVFPFVLWLCLHVLKLFAASAEMEKSSFKETWVRLRAWCQDQKVQIFPRSRKRSMQTMNKPWTSKQRLTFPGWKGYHR